MLLVTTALEETWDKQKKIIFLGDWCLLEKRKHQWASLEYKVLEYHWDDRKKLNKDYIYLKSFHERLLKDLAMQLNHIHGVKHNLNYWRVLVGPWLGYFTQILFDRWESVEQALQTGEVSETVSLNYQENTLVPFDMLDFQRLYLDEGWNHFIYIEILKLNGGLNFIKKNRALSVLENLNKSKGLGDYLRAAKRKITQGLSAVLSVFIRQGDAMLLTTYLSFFDELKMYFLLGQVPQLFSFVAPYRSSFCKERREWVLNDENATRFENFVRGFIPRQIPTLYLEGYAGLLMQAKDVNWPKYPRFIWTSNSAISDDVFKAWASDKQEQGSPLIIGQHGGHYGIGRWMFVEDHELAISDFFLSWGWSSRENHKVVPVGQLKSRRPLGVQHSRQDKALLVTFAMPRQSCHLYNSAIASQWLSYFEDQCIFIESLPSSIRNNFIVRLNKSDYGWGQFSRWRARFPDLTLDDGNCKIDKLIRQSKLYVSTYNATTFLESFTMDVPTVIFWNTEHWELRESAQVYFEELQKVGIFHDSPESAARHVAAIWEDVDLWWQSQAVRTALEKFKDQYTKMPDDLLAKLKSILNEIAPKTGTERSHRK
jgi:putative transferase (TIGR04331 family)